MSKLADFLSRNSVTEGGTLPLVHTLRGVAFENVAETGAIESGECDVFVGENLNYFFMGRPAYKYTSESSEAEYWELPCCFLFEYMSIGPATRIFPFDSGAHHGKMYPEYVSVFEKEQFEVSAVSDGPSKIVGAFFGDVGSYFKSSAKDAATFNSEFALGARDSLVKATHKLARSPAGRSFDDRRMTIEIQTVGKIDLSIVKPLAVILPMIYLDDDHIRKTIVEMWGAEPITYPIFSLSASNYYGLIYERVAQFYTSRGYL